MNILDAYVLKPPSAQNVVDLFAGEWSTAMPAGSGVVSSPGPNPLFDTPHIRRAQRLLGGFGGKTVLELGPLEGAHSYMLQRGGAERVVAIEANSRAFLKCLCVKEIFGLDRVHYKLGDFVAYLTDTAEHFDMAVASGVLYHMANPLRLLDLLCDKVDHLALWTHYFDGDILAANPKLAPKFSALQDGSYTTLAGDVFDHRWALQSYNEALNWAGFCGGTEPTSAWLPRQTILDFLAQRGLVHQHISDEVPLHPHGPCYAVVASRQPLAETMAEFSPQFEVAGHTLALSLVRADADAVVLDITLQSGGPAALYLALPMADGLHLAQGTASEPQWVPLVEEQAASAAPSAAMQSGVPVRVRLPRRLNGAVAEAVHVGVVASGRGGLAQVLSERLHGLLPY
jgi:hypothetical protein